MKKFLSGSLILLSLLHFGMVNAQSLTDSLLIYYPFNGNGNDASGNGYHGDVHATLTADRFGNPNSAYHFNGIDEYINFPLVAELKPQLPISYSFWIKLENMDPTKGVLVTNDFATDNHAGVFMTLSSAGNMGIGMGDASGNTTYANLRNFKGNTVLTTGLWYHIVGIVNGPLDMKIYINCAQETGVYAGTGGALQYTSMPGTLGRKDNAGVAPYYFQGVMDDFRYWNRALTQADVDLLCNETLKTNEVLVNNNFGIFPNPLSGDVLNLPATDFPVQKVRVVSISGQFVFEAVYGETINFSGVAPGLYLIEFYDLNNQKLATEKLQRL